MPRHRLAALSFVLAALLTTAPVPTAGQQPTAPAPVVIDTQDSPSLGPDNAPVTIVEFGDFQCPYCSRGAAAIRKLLAMYPERVRWVFKHYPLETVHPAAALAHEAAVAAQEQGKFWEMHELIFNDPTHVRYNTLVGYAEQIGLDMTAFKDALETRRLRPRVVRDIVDGRRLRVFATPTYFVNGTRYMGARTTPELRVLVETIIRRPVAAPSGATDGPAEGTVTR